MTNTDAEPEDRPRGEHRHLAPVIVPLIPRIDKVIDTAPPWTLPGDPDYSWDPRSKPDHHGPATLGRSA